MRWYENHTEQIAIFLQPRSAINAVMRMRYTMVQAQRDIKFNPYSHASQSMRFHTGPFLSQWLLCPLVTTDVQQQTFTNREYCKEDEYERQDIE